MSRHPNRNGSIFGYYFDQQTSVSDWPVWTGVQHGDEIEYVFGVPIKSTSSQYSQNEQWLSRYMMDYWTRFAKTGYAKYICHSRKLGEFRKPTIYGVGRLLQCNEQEV